MLLSHKAHIPGLTSMPSASRKPHISVPTSWSPHIPVTHITDAWITGDTVILSECTLTSQVLHQWPGHHQSMHSRGRPVILICMELAMFMAPPGSSGLTETNRLAWNQNLPPHQRAQSTLSDSQTQPSLPDHHWVWPSHSLDHRFLCLHWSQR